MNTALAIVRSTVHSAIALVSGLVIAVAVGLGAVAALVAGALIGAAGLAASQLRPAVAPVRRSPQTLHARRAARGWIIDPPGM